MKREVITIILLLWGGIGFAQTISELYQTVQSSVVVVYTKEKVASKVLHQKMMTSDGLGSGVLISKEGYILTAAHVVNVAETIMVGFSDGTKVPAKVVRSVPAADVAVIQLDWMPENRTIARMGNSDEAGIGDQICVIGAPFGLERSLSVGHISARHIDDKRTTGLDRMEFLQTDAAINTGNSGGPMFNMEGEVIGIVSYILTLSGGFEGIGFAVSSNVASTLLTQKGAFWFGAEGFMLNKEMASAFNVPAQGGVLIQKVAKNSPAGKMGLQAGTMYATIDEEEILIGGDIVLTIIGIPVTSQEDLTAVRQKMNSFTTGNVLTIDVLREGRIQTLKYVME